MRAAESRPTLKQDVLTARGAPLKSSRFWGALAVALVTIVCVAGPHPAHAQDAEAGSVGPHDDHAAQQTAANAPHEHAHGQPQDAAVEDPDPMARMEGMEPRDRWMTMVHGWAFVGYNDQGGASGDDSFESQNHIMTMAMRSWLGGKLSLLGTFSLEPATIPDEGSPQLFQRGETFEGNLLVDRQHPHDFFAQLAVSWERKAW